MASVLVVNVALFLPVVAGGVVTSWLGWVLAGRGGDGEGGGGLQTVLSPADPPRPWPVEPGGSAGPDELARSA